MNTSLVGNVDNTTKASQDLVLNTKKFNPFASYTSCTGPKLNNNINNMGNTRKIDTT